MAFVSPQDWMCEPWVVAKTGLDVAEHQRRTILSLLDLREIAPELPWVPVLQGWAGADYMRHIDQYARAGINLVAEPMVGIGTVCRRQATNAGLDIFKLLSWYGLKLHGFGVKSTGLVRGARYLKSADSLAWSYTARRNPPCMPGHTHKNGANCLMFALQWRDKLLGRFPR